MNRFPNLPDFSRVGTDTDDIHLCNVLADEALQILDRMEAEDAAKILSPNTTSQGKPTPTAPAPAEGSRTDETKGKEKR